MEQKNGVAEKKAPKKLSDEATEHLIHDIELVFSYARCHQVSIHPLDENEMIHIINLKQEIMKRLNLITLEKTSK